MLRFLLRRIVFGALLVFTVSSGAWLLARAAPGGPETELFGAGATSATIARERARYGLDRPWAQQYAGWLSRAVRLDLGPSFLYGRPVGELIGRRAANTAVLAGAALLLAALVGIPLGVVAGATRSRTIAFLIRSTSIALLSLPPLVSSLLLVLVAARTGWLPIGGMTSVGLESEAWSAWIRDLAWHLPLPTLALALPLAAMLERLQAQAMAEAVREPFVLAAMARGVPRRRLIWRDTLRVAIRPVAAISGLVLGGLLSGSFIVEVVTAWPGLGRLMYEALRARDLYLVAGCAAAGSVFLAVGSVVSDAALALVDPRVRNDRS